MIRRVARMANTSTNAAAIETGTAREGGLARAIVEASKPGITRLVTITAGVGFAMAAITRSWPPAEAAAAAVGCLAGTALSASGANALNQWIERDRDARMRRTASRPLPSGRATPGSILGAGLALSAAGVLLLWAACGPVPAAVSLFTIASYVLLYTPMKPLTPYATLVGAIPGALPPLIGWTAASAHGGFGSLREPGGWSLVLLMIVWQIPHFLAIAWMYRDDYRLGGFRVLPVVDADGSRTSRAVLRWSVLLPPATVLPWLVMMDRLGLVYLAVAIASGAVFLYMALRLAQTRSRGAARSVFFASIIHLPVLLVSMVADALLVRTL